jgi:hypothetical protein
MITKRRSGPGLSQTYPLLVNLSSATPLPSFLSLQLHNVLVSGALLVDIVVQQLLDQVDVREKHTWEFCVCDFLGDFFFVFNRLQILKRVALDNNCVYSELHPITGNKFLFKNCNKAPYVCSSIVRNRIQ